MSFFTLFSPHYSVEKGERELLNKCVTVEMICVDAEMVTNNSFMYIAGIFKELFYM